MNYPNRPNQPTQSPTQTERDLYERELRRENRIAQDSVNTTNGLFLGIFLAAIAGLVTAFFALAQRDQPALQAPAQPPEVNVQPPEVNVQTPAINVETPAQPPVQAPDVNITVPETQPAPEMQMAPAPGAEAPAAPAQP